MENRGATASQNSQCLVISACQRYEFQTTMYSALPLDSHSASERHRRSHGPRRSRQGFWRRGSERTASEISMAAVSGIVAACFPAARLHSPRRQCSSGITILVKSSPRHSSSTELSDPRAKVSPRARQTQNDQHNNNNNCATNARTGKNKKRRTNTKQTLSQVVVNEAAAKQTTSIPQLRHREQSSKRA